MSNSIVDTLSFTDAPSLTESAQTVVRAGIGRADHDIEEIAIGFGQSLASRSIFGEVRDSRRLGSASFGQMTYRRVDPLHEPLKVADARLQKHLEDLCESLRAKY